MHIGDQCSSNTSLLTSLFVYLLSLHNARHLWSKRRFMVDTEARTLGGCVVPLCRLPDAQLRVNVRCELARSVDARAPSDFNLLVEVERQCGYAPRLRHQRRAL